MADSISRKAKAIIAQECGLERKAVTDKTRFLANKDLSYFVCMDTLYTLQQKFNVLLPESSFGKYMTVRGVIRDIVRQTKGRPK